MKAALIFSAALCVLIGALPEPAHASQVVGQWYHGNWSCRSDGRPARMRWVVRDDPGPSNCRYDARLREQVCSRTSGVTTVGEFWDRNGPWRRLTIQTRGQNSLHFRHADGNPWFLQRSGSRANGWTTWNGNRYPLQCSRA